MGRFLLPGCATNLPRLNCNKDIIGPKEVACLVFSPDGAGQEAYTFRGHDGSISGLAFSPDGFSVASTGIDGSVKVWDVISDQGMHYKRDVSGPFAFSPDGSRIISFAPPTSTNEIKIWDAASGKEISRLKLEDPIFERYGFGNRVTTFSQDGMRLAASDIKNSVAILDTETGKKLCDISGAVDNLMFSPDHQVLAGTI